jgi:stage III sporulation protein AH
MENTQITMNTTAVAGVVDPVERFRAERQQLRQMQISQLNDLIYGGTASEEIVLLAQKRLLELMDWTEKETTIEGVLSIRDFKDVVATVHEDSINILIRSDALTKQQTAVILDLVMRETGFSGGNVKIIPIN